MLIQSPFWRASCSSHAQSWEKGSFSVSVVWKGEDIRARVWSWILKTTARYAFMPGLNVPVRLLLWLKQDHCADLQVVTNGSMALRVTVTQAVWYIEGSVNLVSLLCELGPSQGAGEERKDARAGARLFIKMRWPIWLARLSCKWDDDLWRQHEWLWWSLPFSFLMQSSGLEGG